MGERTGATPTVLILLKKRRRDRGLPWSTNTGNDHPPTIAPLTISQWRWTLRNSRLGWTMRKSRRAGGQAPPAQLTSEEQGLQGELRDQVHAQAGLLERPRRGRARSTVGLGWRAVSIMVEGDGRAIDDTTSGASARPTVSTRRPSA